MFIRVWLERFKVTSLNTALNNEKNLEHSGLRIELEI
jgi:hypothetical protein